MNTGFKIKLDNESQVWFVNLGVDILKDVPAEYRDDVSKSRVIALQAVIRKKTKEDTNTAILATLVTMGYLNATVVPYVKTETPKDPLKPVRKLADEKLASGKITREQYDTIMALIS